MTYRDRRLARAARLAAWADKRDARAAGAFDTVHRIADGIPMGQPILVGHHSERRARKDAARIDSGMRAGIEHSRMADSMRSRAASIEAAAAHAIYRDDEDALPRLLAKIARLEEERDRIKAYNASCRTAAKAGRSTGDLSILTAAERASLLVTARVAAYSLGKGGAFPGYHLTNLSGNIARHKARLPELERRAAALERVRIALEEESNA